MKPANAEKPENQLHVKLNLEVHRINQRRYPEVSIDDDVKLNKKKDKLDKEHIPVWQNKVYKVKDITTSFGQKKYHLEGYTQNGKEVPLLRHEISKIN